MVKCFTDGACGAEAMLEQNKVPTNIQYKVGHEKKRKRSEATASKL